MVSFFGMNVATFKDDPPLKWFFVSAIPFMLLVLGLWFLLRRSFSRSSLLPAVRQQRAAFEAVSAELESRRPDLWMRQGPRENVRPADRASQLKLALVRSMTAATVGQLVPLNAAGPVDAAGPVGGWSRLKARLIRRWAEQIVLAPPEPGSESGAPEVPVPSPAASEKTVITSTHEVPDDDDAEASASVMVEERPDASRRWGASSGAGTSGRAHMRDVHASSAAERPARPPRRDDDELLAHPPVSGAGGGEGAKGKKDK